MSSAADAAGAGAFAGDADAAGAGAFAGDADAALDAPDGVPDGLLDAFWAYETALMANDLDALDRLFAPGPGTLRGDAAGLLIGHDAISAFRQGRAGAPARRILSVYVRAITEDAALVVAVTSPTTGGRGQQTQLWRRDATRWVIEAAHVSAPAPAIASAVWRVVGSPLVAPSNDATAVGAAFAGAPAAAASASARSTATRAASASLRSHTVAVKDLFAVAGYPTGGGVPAFLAEQQPASRNASAVDALLAAGASVQGIAQTDEFAYSMAGKNPHYGTPPNALVPGAIPGGSSSGPASAVASGQASIGLGTDTGGSIRVPASYQALWGLRTTHGSVPADGLLPLAPSFDTIGWLTRDPAVLAAAAAATLDPADQRSLAPDVGFVVAPALLEHASPDVQTAFADTTRALLDAGAIAELPEVDLGDIDTLFDTFRTCQAAEAWRSHGEWIGSHPGALGDDIAARFAWAASVTEEAEASARVARAAARTRIEDALAGRILLLPSASSIAPSTMAPAADIELIRASTLRLTCVAGLAGLPALSAPLLWVGGGVAAGAGVDAGAAASVGVGTPPAPVGLCLVGPRFTDLALIEVGARLAAALGV